MNPNSEPVAFGSSTSRRQLIQTGGDSLLDPGLLHGHVE